MAAPRAEAAPVTRAKPDGPTKIESVRSGETALFVTGRGGPILTVRIDRKRLATLNRLFSGPSLGTIAHFLVLNALAVTDALPGDGNDPSIAAFVAQQEQLLSRAMIALRLGKTLAPDSISAVLPAFPPRVVAHSARRPISLPPAGELVLVRAFSANDTTALQQIVSGNRAAPFERAAQLFVGLCANDAIIAGESERQAAGKALVTYAALATEEIGRLFVRSKAVRAPAPFRPTDTELDDAARAVLATLQPAST
jgi:hypothetical protein